MFKDKISIASSVQLPIYQQINSEFTKGSFRLSTQYNIFLTP
jgi:hypothetical protein